MASKGASRGNEPKNGGASGGEIASGTPSGVEPVAAPAGRPVSLPATFQGQDSALILAFSPDGRLLAAGTPGGIVLWSLETGKAGVKLEFPAPDRLLFSPDGKFVAATGPKLDNASNRDIGVLSVADGKRIVSGLIEDVPFQYQAPMAFSPKGGLFAALATGNEIVVTNLADGSERSRCTGHTAAPIDLAFGPGGNLLYSSAFDQSLREWNLSQPAASSRMLVANQYSGQVVPLADGKTLLTSGSGELFQWDVSGPGLAALVQKVLEGATDLKPLDDGKSLALFGANQPVVIWDSASKTIKTRMKAVSLGFQPKGTALSKDGRTLAVVVISATNQSTLELWDVASSQRRAKHDIDPSHQSENCAISASGEVVAVGCRDGSILLWPTGVSGSGPGATSGVVEAKATLKHRSAVKSVGFSPDGKTVAVGLIPNRIDEQNVEMQEHLAAGNKEFRKFAERFAPEVEKCEKEFHAAVEVARRRILRVEPDVQAQGVMFRQELAKLKQEQERNLDQRVGEHLRSALEEFYGQFLKKYQASVPWAEVAALWNAETGANLQSLEQPPFSKAEFNVGAFSNDLPGILDPAKTPFGGPPLLLGPGYLAWVHRRDGIQVLDLISRQTKAWKQSTGEQIDWLISPDGKTLLVQGRVLRKVKKPDLIGGFVEEKQQATVFALVDVASGKPRGLSGPLAGPQSACFSADGAQLLAVAGISDEPSAKLAIRRWKVATLEEIAPPLPVSGSDAASLAVSPDGKWLATVQTIGSRPELRVLDLTTGHERPTVLNGDVDLLTWSPDSQTLAVITKVPDRDLHRVELVDLKTGQPRATIADLASPVQSLAFSPDSRMLAVGGGSHAGGDFNSPGLRSAIGDLQATSELKLFDAASGKLAAPLAGHDDQITCVAFSPDGLLLASGGIDGQVKLWDVAAALKAGATPASTMVAAPVPATPEIVPATTAKSNLPKTAPSKTATVKSDASPAAKQTGDTNSIGMKLVPVHAGEFQMGSPDDDPNAEPTERPAHRVRLTKAFSIGAHEVTVGQFRAFVEASGYQTDTERDGLGGAGYDAGIRQFVEANQPQFSWRNIGVEQTDNHPAVNVSWNDAAAFCTWLSGKEGKRYRLPTEAEWEYACRAGTTTRFPTGDEDSSLKGLANIGDVSLKKSWDAATWVVSWNDGFAFTSPVGTWKANAWGIHDMVGNAGEWTGDWFDAEYYQNSPESDPRGPKSGEFRVVRGGGWYYHPPFQRSAMRVPGCPPTSRNVLVGFRVVRER